MEQPPASSLDALPAPPPSQSGQVGRALFSASVFGAMGGAIGHWLGVRGNEPKRQLAAPIMKWGMGIFSAILAAYSSFKASERVNATAREQPVTPDMPVATVAETMLAAVASDPKPLPVPLTSVHADGVTHAPLSAAALQRV